ncbi:actin-binding LIM protein 1 isoform X5 [Clarias gariepinus]|uniref:actin-binding LIM protein 1 isoform X5 n=1 Tax=Clarias gariepinus TaxID=13013 RepID=UPI00234D9526|nr:actin-binding LIM protein 1 isoform X5 [Clarias gariepinus]
MVMVKEKVAHPQEAHRPPEKLVIQCFKCGEPCKGEVLRVQSKHFHIKCFTCKVCGCDLAQGGFFMKNGEYLCTLDYQRLHGTRCHGCGNFVEGEVVTALGKTYHPTCFVCTICKRPFPAGDRVTFNGKDCLCQRCIQPMSPPPKAISASSNCAGCGRDIKNGQALLALDRQWHLGCFKCKACGKVLSGEYISKDGAPYCERDYQIHFGVQCEACHQYITGRVLEAGDKHYHPSCARCSRCNQMFTEGEEMYLQGSTVWHPDCKSNIKVEEKYRGVLQRPGRKPHPFDIFLPLSKCESQCKTKGRGGSARGVRLLRRTELLPPSVTSLHQSERQPTRSSSESICSRPGSSIPGSPGHTIYAKVDNEIIDYKDLAAIPRVKAIYDIERPDMISYESLQSTSSTLERQGRHSPGECQSTTGDQSPIRGHIKTMPQDPSPMSAETSPRTLSPTPSAEGCYDIRERIMQRSTSQGSIGSPMYSRHNYTPTLSKTPQHFHRPGMLKLCSSLRSSNSDNRPTSPFRHHFLPHNKGTEPSSGRSSPLSSRSATPTLCLTPKHFHVPDQGMNMYRKPPIYKQHAALAAQSKFAGDIIKSSKFPAAQAPRVDEKAKIETDYWPCPPSHAALGSDMRSRSRDEEEEEQLKRRQLHENHLSKIQSGLGKLIFKEEMEKEMNRERYARSVAAQRYDPQYSNFTADPNSPTCKTSSLPGYGRNGLLRSTEFSQYNSYGDVCGGQRDFKVCE